MFELLAGNAGIALGALQAGDTGLAVLAVEPYQRTADRTPRRGSTGRCARARRVPIISPTAPWALCTRWPLSAPRPGGDDLTGLALMGAADVAARNEAGPAGFVVPHSDPPHRPDLIERYSFGWCNGPAGDAQAFRLLGAVTGDPALGGAGRPLLAHRDP